MSTQGNIRDLNAEILLRQGRQYQEALVLEKALDCFQRAKALDPTYSAIHFSLGVVLGKLGRWGEAAAAYREAIRLRPSYTEAYSNLGFVLYEMGLDSEAQESFKRAADLGGLAKPAKI